MKQVTITIKALFPDHMTADQLDGLAMNAAVQVEDPDDEITLASPPSCTTTAFFGDGPVSLVLNAGHNEYTIAEAPGLIVEELWSPHGDNAPIDGFFSDEREAAEEFRRQLGFLPPDGDLTWSTVLRLTGTPESLSKAFMDLLVSLNRVPSGDDDSFDYWPSGVRLAEEFSEHLPEDATTDLKRIITAVFAAGSSDVWNADILGLDHLTT